MKRYYLIAEFITLSKFFPMEH